MEYNISYRIRHKCATLFCRFDNYCSYSLELRPIREFSGRSILSLSSFRSAEHGSKNNGSTFSFIVVLESSTGNTGLLVYSWCWWCSWPHRGSPPWLCRWREWDEHGVQAPPSFPSTFFPFSYFVTLIGLLV